MNHRRNILILVAAALLLAASCRSHRQAAVNLEPGSETTPEAGSGTTAGTPRQYTVITFDGTVEGISVNGQIRMAKDSIIWCSVTKLLEVGRAMATPDSVWVRSTLFGVDKKGPIQKFQRRVGADISFEQLQTILESDDAEQRLVDLSKRFGHPATVRFTRRQQVDRLSFPFTK